MLFNLEIIEFEKFLTAKLDSAYAFIQFGIPQNFYRPIIFKLGSM